MANHGHKLGRRNQVVVCKGCGKRTTQATGQGTGYCGPCLDAAELENACQDGQHDDAPVAGCPTCPGVGA